jgi:hypothetical protein
MTDQQAEHPGPVTRDAAETDLRVKVTLCTGDSALAWWEEALSLEQLVALLYENFLSEDLAAADEQVRELAVVEVACGGLVALELKAKAIRRTQARQTPQAAAWLARCRQRASEVFGSQARAPDA